MVRKSKDLRASEQTVSQAAAKIANERARKELLPLLQTSAEIQFVLSREWMPFESFPDPDHGYSIRVAIEKDRLAQQVMADTALSHLAGKIGDESLQDAMIDSAKDFVGGILNDLLSNDSYYGESKNKSGH